jgi:hypothetical protein
MPHFCTSLGKGDTEMEIPKMTYFEPASDITRLNSWKSGQDPKRQLKHNPQDPSPIEIEGILVPNFFGMKIYFESPNNKGMDWCVTLHLRIGPSGIPKTSSIEVSGDGHLKHKWDDDVVFVDENRVERKHLEIATQELRRLEALSIMLAAETWTYDKKLNSWQFRAGNEVGDIAQARKQLKRLEKEIMNRVSYRKIDDVFLKQVAELFKQGKKRGVSPYGYISDEMKSAVADEVPRKTVQRWVTEARKAGYLKDPETKKVSANKVGSKPKTKAKKGE